MVHYSGLVVATAVQDAMNAKTFMPRQWLIARPSVAGSNTYPQSVVLRLISNAI